MKTKLQIAIEEVQEETLDIGDISLTPTEEVNSVNNDLDESAAAMDDATALDQIASTVDKVELTEAEAAVVTAAVEAITRRYNLRTKNKLSVESYKLNTAKESISETAKKIWQAILTFFKGIKNWIKDFINSFGLNVDKLQEKCSQLKQKARTIGKLNVTEIKWFNELEYLIHDKQVTFDGAIKGIKEYETVITDVFSDCGLLIKAVGSFSHNDLLNEIHKGKNPFRDVEIEAPFEKIPHFTKLTTPNEYHYISIDLIGNKNIVFATPRNDGSERKTIKTKFDFKNTSAFKNPDIIEIQNNNIQNLLDTIRDLLTELGRTKIIIKALGDTSDINISIIEKAVSSFEENGIAKYATEFKNTIAYIVMLLQKVITTLSSYGMHVSLAGLKLCEHALK